VGSFTLKNKRVNKGKQREQYLSPGNILFPGATLRAEQIEWWLL